MRVLMNLHVLFPMDQMIRYDCSDEMLRPVAVNELIKHQAKGAILSRAVQYIHQLKENEARNIEKWTLEKLLMDQAMGDLQVPVHLAKLAITD